MNNATVSVIAVTTTTDDNGDSTTEAVETVLSWAVVAPRSSDERSDPRAPAVIAAATLLAPFDTELDADDLVVIDAHSPAMNGEWQVEGMPGPWSSPFSNWKPGLEVALKRAH